LRVGVFVISRSSAGGTYQYTQQIIRSLAQEAPESQVIVFATCADSGIEQLAGRTVRVVGLSSYETLRVLASAIPSRGRALGNKQGAGKLRRFLGQHVLGRAARKEGVDVLVFPTPAPEAAVCGVPFIYAIHDLQHLLHPEFPEVSAHGEAARREAMNRPAVAKARAVLVDSEQSRQDVVRYYQADPSRVHALFFVSPVSSASDASSASIAGVRRKYGLPDVYAFYPAQFWPHKNHSRLIQAVARVPGLGLVLTGTRDVAFSTFEAVERDLAKYLPGRAWLLGYVPQADIGPLYSAATVLAMPTFFGPTNIPIVEAFELGVPVITSDMPGVQEQVGDAALLVDPSSVESLASALTRVVHEPELRAQLIARGKARNERFSPRLFSQRLQHILAGAARAREQ
jgi:glycosyltransferase involved in cell wall biosynthesis